MLDIMCKSKRSFHFSEGIARTIGNDLVLILDLIQNLLPKKIERKNGSLFRYSKMVGPLNFLGQK
jgi:hypothetical protein